MTSQPNLELISFKLCPFVQRAVIVLKEKGLDFKITYIDLKQKPDWFLQLSPLGKVPVLRVDDTVLFESAVIAEFLDEISPPALQPQDPLLRAKNRAWTEFASELLSLQYQFLHASGEQNCLDLRGKLRERFERLEKILDSGPYFNGPAFSLADAAFAPLFMRLDLIEKAHSMKLLAGLPKVVRWSQNLLARGAVRESVVADFPRLFSAYLQQSSCLMAA